MSKERRITLRLRPEVGEQLDRAVKKAGRRSQNQCIEMALEDWLKQRGFEVEPSQAEETTDTSGTLRETSRTPRETKGRKTPAEVAAEVPGVKVGIPPLEPKEDW